MQHRRRGENLIAFPFLISVSRFNPSAALLFDALPEPREIDRQDRQSDHLLNFSANAAPAARREPHCVPISYKRVALQSIRCVTFRCASGTERNRSTRSSVRPPAKLFSECSTGGAARTSLRSHFL